MELSQFKDKLIESAIGNVLMYGMNLILPVIVSRLYGVETYGGYVYGITMVSIAMYLANLGMDMGLMYFVPKTGKKYVKAAFSINIASSMLAMIGLYLFSSKSVTPYLGLVWLLSAEQLFFSLFRVKHNVRPYFYIKSLIGIGGTILLSGLFHIIFGNFEWCIILATYISSFILLFLFYRRNKDMFGDLAISKEFLEYSVTIIFGGVLSLVIAYIDIVMIEAMMSKSDVGLYKVGTELAQLPSMFLRIINTVFPPLISKLYHEGKVEEVRGLYEKLTRYLFVVSSITIGLIIVLWKPILSLYGLEYLAARNVLIYRSIGQLVNASVGSVWFIVIMTGHPRIRTIALIASAGINVVLNYLLIPSLGIDGAAIASMTATVLINIIGFFVVKRILKSKVYYII